MKSCIALLALCLATSYSHAQSTVLSPSQTLQQQEALAQASYNKHAYAEAAAILEKLSVDPQVTALSDWPNDLYNLACYQALEGKPALAILTLKQSFDLGNTILVEDIGKAPDLISLHSDPQFQELIARMTKAAALWKDDPAIATPYKPVLTEDEKVAGLSKFWSEARFNFPFFSRLPDLDWDREYMDYLPQVRSAQTTADYYRVMMRFAALLHDGHTNVYPPEDLYFDTFIASPPLRTQLVEDKVLVKKVFDPALEAQGVHVGSEIVSVDGKPVREYAESAVAPYASSSTTQDRNVRIYGYQLLAGPKEVPVRLTLRDASGETKSVSVHRYCEASSKCSQPGNDPAQFKMLPGNIAYLAVNEFEDDRGAKAMRENFAAIEQAKGLIVDVRENGGGSSDNGYKILSMLTSKPFQGFSAKTLDYKPAYRAWGGQPGWSSIAPDELSPDAAHYFSKPVIVLISAKSFSAAEDFVVVFDAMHRGTLVGETTGGSTGQPLVFKLPGGGYARICTLDVAYPDGRDFEGIGIPPQVKVSPTVADIRQGRDAALERAIELLR
jgi:C-terminal processing protease CtpA/Prc